MQAVHSPLALKITKKQSKTNTIKLEMKYNIIKTLEQSRAQSSRTTSKMTTILLQLETFDKSNLRSTTGTRGLVQPSTALTMKGQYDTADPRVLADNVG